MPIVVREYAEEHIEAVRQFNGRLRAGGEALQFPLSATPEWLPKLPGRALFQEYYLAIDDAGAVHGAYILKHQDFCIKDQVVSIADLHSPVSEGAVSKNYPQIGVQLLRDALGRQPLLFGLGMGSYEESLPRLLKAAGWSMFSVPFFFRVVRPRKFLQNISHLRRQQLRRWLLDILAETGLGWLGLRVVQAACARKTRCDPAVTVEEVEEFSDWADDLWNGCKNQYGMSAVRDAETLCILYPRENKRFIRLRILEQSKTIGWAVLLDTTLSNHKQFGNMRLGSIVDGFASPCDAVKIIGAARDCLESRGVDLIVSNQSHVAWQQGFRKAGFFQGPSNFIFTSSPKLTDRLRQCGVTDEDLHINRGDGEGPINL
jgi:hypothetical protein